MTAGDHRIPPVGLLGVGRGHVADAPVVERKAAVVVPQAEDRVVAYDVDRVAALVAIGRDARDRALGDLDPGRRLRPSGPSTVNAERAEPSITMFFMTRRPSERTRRLLYGVARAGASRRRGSRDRARDRTCRA